MKGLKKVLTGILAATMILGASINVAASSTDGTAAASQETVGITINQGADATGTTTVTHTYFEIFKASISGTNYSYYIPSNKAALKAAVDGITITKNGETIDVFSFTESSDGSRYNVTVDSRITEDDGNAIAEALNISSVTNNAISTGTFTDSVSGIDKGYYLITSSLGSGLVLETLESKSITEKNTYITTDKTASVTNMAIGDTVTYTITVKVPASAKVGDEITVHDTLDTVHLQMQESTLVAKLGEAAVTLNEGDKAATETFAKKFTVTEAMLNNEVVLTYDAVLLSTAADDTGYVNEVFSNTSSYTTETKKVRVWTFDFNLDKTFVGVTDATEAAAKVATFKLTDAQNNEVKLKTDDTGYYVDATGSSTITVTGGPAVNIRGLKAGTYKLTELTTADGFNLLTDPVIVIITDKSDADAATNFTAQISHKVEYKFGENNQNVLGGDNNDTVAIENNSGTRLPSTGGIGTTIFYIIGGLLIVAAVVFFVVRRRNDAE